MCVYQYTYTYQTTYKNEYKKPNKNKMIMFTKTTQTDPKCYPFPRNTK